jgi:hypothetical protein
LIISRDAEFGTRNATANDATLQISAGKNRYAKRAEIALGAKLDLIEVGT